VECTDRGKSKHVEKRVPLPLHPSEIAHGLGWDRTLTFAVRGGRLTACVVAWFYLKLSFFLLNIKSSVHTSQRTQHVHYKDQSVLLFRETIFVYFEDHYKHINA
jgi:hypothetical protein